MRLCAGNPRYADSVDAIRLRGIIGDLGHETDLVSQIASRCLAALPLEHVASQSAPHRADSRTPGLRPAPYSAAPAESGARSRRDPERQQRRLKPLPVAEQPDPDDRSAQHSSPGAASELAIDPAAPIGPTACLQRIVRGHQRPPSAI